MVITSCHVVKTKKVCAEDAFCRVCSNLSIKEYTGTGIGLAIVKKIVDNHNGIITATDELNKGAIFDIYTSLN